MKIKLLVLISSGLRDLATYSKECRCRKRKVACKINGGKNLLDHLVGEKTFRRRISQCRDVNLGDVWT